MSVPQKNQQIPVGFLTHVGASRREPHFYSCIPGSKTGDFSYPVEPKRFQRTKMSPYIAVSFQTWILQPFSELKAKRALLKTFLSATKAYLQRQAVTYRWSALCTKSP